MVWAERLTTSIIIPYLAQSNNIIDIEGKGVGKSVLPLHEGHTGRISQYATSMTVYDNSIMTIILSR